ncbi:hypothetical protein SAMN06269185_1981 [Natronoarchaeum philippinense]|uniref:Uncharacterized protein n=1 Tax=Natronoarchaeum philippinense TaxID=558529 RepID=A0A285NYF0_NATPI|nr:hypothetical protein [Natronoarchaeum philippinense]SNZ12916.1 hypothetical protein SAMN06269185_1981 [Natronoarchaeum philippinense]
MPDLSACYFCGAAADAPVREYDVVPDDSLRSTAMLCSGCRKKLETVLSSAVRGARPSDQPLDVTLDSVDGDADASASALETESGAGLAAAEQSGDASASPPVAGDDGETSDPSAESEDTPDPLAGSTDDSTTEGIVFDAEADASASGSDDSEEVAAGEDGDAHGDDAAASGAAETPESAGAAASASNERQPDADIERPDTDTYNRVVRLLQNREFPVNRSEFSELASSAYDIPADECARVIDYAIYRGELVEESGMLKQP